MSHRKVKDMKCYGYTKDNQETLLDLSEVTFQTSPIMLKSLGKFLIKSANEIEKDPDWEHKHFKDFDSLSKSSLVDVIVFGVEPS